MSKSDYEKLWPSLRLEWAKDKIQEWERRLSGDLPLLERRKVEDDIVKMKLALKGWEMDKSGA